MSARRKKPSRVKILKSERYKGWSIRKCKIMDTGKIFWQTDNNLTGARERIGWPTIDDARTHIKQQAEAQKNEGLGAYALTQTQKIEAKKVFDQYGDKLAEVLKFWEDRHPADGDKKPLGEMIDAFLKERQKLGQRPETIRELRSKLKAFKLEIGEERPIGWIMDDEVLAFVNGRDGGTSSRRAWKKVLGAFFGYCEEDCHAIKGNPARTIKIPKQIRKPPVVWTPSEVESTLRIAEREEPQVAAGLAILFFAGVRPSELTGGYGLEDARVKAAKDELAEARKVYKAEKKRLGLVRRRGADTALQAKRRKWLEASEPAVKMRDAVKKLAEARKRHRQKQIPGLDWRDIRLDDADEKFISIRAETSKTQQQRHVDILPNLESWLQKYRKISGPVVDNPTAFRRARERILKKLEKARWTQDVARHSFASYHFKHFANRDKLAEMLGHTDQSKQIERHYKNATVAKADAEAYWKIMPEGETLPASGPAPQMATKGA